MQHLDAIAAAQSHNKPQCYRGGTVAAQTDKLFPPAGHIISTEARQRGAEKSKRKPQRRRDGVGARSFAAHTARICLRKRAMLLHFMDN